MGFDGDEKAGFLDVPKIISQRREKRLFPGLLADVKLIREKDFPLFDRLKRIYLDSTATSQQPQSVKDRMHIYRSTHIRGSNHSENSAEAKEAQARHDEARKKVLRFFNAENYIVAFTSGTTDSSNWVATRFPFDKGDALILTDAEHNSQILTARHIAKEKGVDVFYVPITLPDGKLDMEYLAQTISARKSGKILLNLVHVSNVSGIINPVKEIRKMLGKRGFIYLDMAQSAGHLPIDLNELDVDFAGISSHKMYGPMGLGAVFVNKKSERFIGNGISGGSAVNLVSRKFTDFSDAPARFEPGTQDIEGAIELGYTIDYLKQIGMENIEQHDRELGKYFMSELKKINGLSIYGPVDFRERTAVITFNITGINHKDVAKKLDFLGISVRNGCFCSHIYTSQLMGAPKMAQEVRTMFGKLGFSKDFLMIPGAVRVSFAFYNTLDDAYKAVVAIRELAHQ